MIVRDAWQKLLTFGGVGLSQAVVQGLSFVSGLLVLQILDVHQYAIYTVAGSVLGFLSGLSDSGVTTALLEQGGRVWRDRGALGGVLAAGLAIRWKIARVVSVLVLPFLLMTLRRHGASWMEAVVVTSATLASSWIALYSAVWGIAPNLHQKLATTQKVALSQAVLKILLFSMAMLIWPIASVPLIIGVGISVWSASQLRAVTAQLADLQQGPERNARVAILTSMYRVMPGAIYYACSGQITVWLISVVGTSASLAQVGALGRLAQLFVLISSVVGAVVVPRFARMDRSARHTVVKRYFQILICLVVIYGALVALTGTWPRLLLWLLGSKYNGLESEVLMQMVAAGLTSLFGTIYWLGAAAKCIPHPALSIPIELSAQVICVMIMPVATVSGVLSLQIITASVSLLLYFIYFIFRFRAQRPD